MKRVTRKRQKKQELADVEYYKYRSYTRPRFMDAMATNLIRVLEQRGFQHTDLQRAVRAKVEAVCLSGATLAARDELVGQMREIFALVEDEEN